MLFHQVDKSVCQFNPNFIGPFDKYSNQMDLLVAPNLLPLNGGEHGLLAAYTFLSTHNHLFIRDNADLLILFISDEDDRSTLSAEVLYEWLVVFKAARQVDVISVTALDLECGSPTGQKYINLANLFDKDALDICSNSWQDWLASSSILLSMRDRVELSEEPIPDSIVVYDDGDYQTNWAYDEKENTVYLHFPLDYGSVVEVGYKVLD